MTETIEVFDESAPASPTPAPDEFAGDPVMQALMARIRPVSEAPLFTKMLMYGGAGVGKTTLAGSAKNCLVLDVEKGAQSLRNHAASRNADVLEFKSIKQIEVFLEKALTGIFSDRYDTIVLDSYTVLQEYDVQAIAAEAYNKSADKRVEYVPQLQDYNASTNHMKRIGSLLRDVPLNVIAIAQMKEVKDDSTGRLLIRPSFTDKLNLSLNHLFSTIGYLSVDSEGNRMLQVHPSDRISAKTRIGNLPTVIVNPDINELISANSATPED